MSVSDLHEFQIKQLLEDIEKSGVPRQSIDFSYLCGVRKGFYEGQPRAFQYKLSNLKKKPIQAYIKKELNYHKVAPSERTLQELDEDDEKGLAVSFGDLKLESQSQFPASPPLPPPSIQRPTRMQSPGAPVPPSSVAQGSVSTTSGFSTESSAVLPTFAGSVLNPHVIEVNVNYPERHRDGFEVYQVNNVYHRGSDYKTFHIRKSVSLPQLTDWEAWIPDGFDAYRGRAIMVKGPSQDHFHQDPDLYNHQNSETKKAHMKLTIAIEEDDNRKWTHYLLVFPPGTVLDNRVFQGDNTKKVATQYVPLQEEDEYPIVDTRLIGASVYFTIAESESGEKVESSKKKPDLFPRSKWSIHPYNLWFKD